MNDVSIVRGMRYVADLDVVYMDTCRYAALGLLYSRFVALYSAVVLNVRLAVCTMYVALV